MSALSDPGSVAVIITCFNQARFLREATDSVNRQSRPVSELIVVDDGSTDDTGQVALAAGVRCVRHENRGLAAARNTGLRLAESEFVVFLDADDRLLPEAVASGVAALIAHPHAVLAWGGYRNVDERGAHLTTNEAVDPGDAGIYPALLRSNFIGMHGAVMYRRSMLLAAGGFDERLRRCEDYELFLRLARRHSFVCHPDIVADYRRHPGGMSLNAAVMSATVLEVLRRERPLVDSDPHLQRAWHEGMTQWRAYYGDRLVGVIGTALRNRSWSAAAQGTVHLFNLDPKRVVLTGWRKVSTAQRLRGAERRPRANESGRLGCNSPGNVQEGGADEQ